MKPTSNCSLTKGHIKPKLSDSFAKNVYWCAFTTKSAHPSSVIPASEARRESFRKKRKRFSPRRVAEETSRNDRAENRSTWIKVFSFSCLTILWPLFFTAFSPVPHADAFQAELKPAGIRQGDAFLLRVTGLKGSTEPSATLKKEPLRFSSCGKGCFVSIGAVDLNSRPGIYRIPLKIGKRKTLFRLRVSKGRFETIHLTLPEEKVSPGPEDIERINREAALLNSIWLIESGKLWEGNFVLPLENPLSTPFGTKRIINKETVSIHRGLDIKGKEGEEIRASNRGRVVLTEELFFGGNTLILDHGQGIYTVYMHMSRFNVSPGDLVAKNDIVGFVGSSGRSSGPHLHFGVKVRGMNTDPVSITRLKL